MNITTIKEEPILFALCRLDPALDFEGADKKRPGSLGKEVAEKLQSVFQIKESNKLLVVDSLGRWDLLVVARLSSFEFQRAGRLPDIEGLKKIDFQYGYGHADELVPFFNSARELPFVLLGYLHVRDDLSLRFPQTHAAVRDDLRGKCADKTRGGNPAVSVRLLGWPDFAVVVAGCDIESLMLWMRDEIWSMHIRPVIAEQLGSNSKPWTSLRDSAEVVFSRTFTVPCVGSEITWDKIDKQLPYVQVDLRVRPGADTEVASIVSKQSEAKGLKPLIWQQPGCTDITVILDEDNQPKALSVNSSPTESVPVAGNGILTGTIIPWYLQNLMPELRELITTSEMRIGITPPTKTCSYIPRHSVLPTIDFPQNFLERADLSPAAASVADCIRNMCRSMNAVSLNDGLYAVCADLHLHTFTFLKHTEDVLLADEKAWPRCLADASRVSELFATALGQRLSGSYYDLMADRPASSVEHVGGQQKQSVALWGLQDALLQALLDRLGTTSPVFGYWLISPSGNPAGCVPCGNNLFIYEVCSSLPFNAPAACHVIGHEIGHAAYHSFIAAAGIDIDYDEWQIPEEGMSLSELPVGGSAEWRRVSARVLRDVFADVYAFFLTLGADIETYRASISDLLIRLNMADRQDLAELALRAWVIQLCADAFINTIGFTDFFEAARTYGTMSPDRMNNVLLPQFDDALVDTDNKNKVETVVLNGMDDAIETTWTNAIAYYHDAGLRDLFNIGWQEARENDWLDVAFLVHVESAVQWALRASAWSLGLAAGETDQSESGKVAEDMTRTFGAELRGGASSGIERMWASAMLSLSQQVSRIA